MRPPPALEVEAPAGEPLDGAVLRSETEGGEAARVSVVEHLLRLAAAAIPVVEARSDQEAAAPLVEHHPPAFHPSRRWVERAEIDP